jgi:hypothetical protein
MNGKYEFIGAIFLFSSTQFHKAAQENKYHSSVLFYYKSTGIRADFSQHMEDLKCFTTTDYKAINLLLYILNMC